MIDWWLFNRGTPGEPTQIKCILRGSNKVRLGEKLEADILVLVKDKHGNEIKKVMASHYIALITLHCITIKCIDTKLQ